MPSNSAPGDISTSQDRVEPGIPLPTQEQMTATGGVPQFAIWARLPQVQAKHFSWLWKVFEWIFGRKGDKAGFLGRIAVVLSLVTAILTLWPAFAGARDAKASTELAKWTARKDFLEYCESHNWEPVGCDKLPNYLDPPPIYRRQECLSDHGRDDNTLHLVTFIIFNIALACSLIIFSRSNRSWLSDLNGRYNHIHRDSKKHDSPTPQLPKPFKPTKEQGIKTASINNTTGFESQRVVPRRRAAGLNSQRTILPSTTAESLEDDSALIRHPVENVDYLSHEWHEEDIHHSWRYVQRQRNGYINAARLENAAWRTWSKSRYNLSTTTPETINCLKDCDVTWLYGPLQSCTTVLYTPTGRSEDTMKSILRNEEEHGNVEDKEDELINDLGRGALAIQ